MVGKHAVRAGRLRRMMPAGVRELFVVAALGLAFPVAALVAVPALTDGGTAMEDATLCGTSTTDCLEPVAATLSSLTVNPTWVLSTESGDAMSLSFPSAEPPPESAAPLHVLLWTGEPVALLQADGKVVGSLEWGRLHDVSVTALLLAPLWPLALIALGWLVLRRHRTKLVLLTIVALGTAVAGPASAASMQLFGYEGLVAGGLVPIAVAFLVAGVTLGVMRFDAARSRPVRRAQAAAVRVPEQRHESAGVPVDLR